MRALVAVDAVFLAGVAQRRAPGGDGAGHVGQEGRLVAARSRAIGEIARGEVGSVGLDQQAARGDEADQGPQLLAAALVADPAGDADVEIERQVALQRGAREAVLSDDDIQALTDPRAAPPGVRVWRADEVTIAGGHCRAGGVGPQQEAHRRT